jgi:hypothetical protein
MSMIGKKTILQGKRVASSSYKFKFDKPGQYDKRDYELNTTKMKLDIK